MMWLVVVVVINEISNNDGGYEKHNRGLDTKKQNLSKVCVCVFFG
jgi:hypothetical protein